MRKKLIIIIIAIILLLTTVFFSVYCIFTAPKYKGEFSIGDFSDTIELFPFSGNKNYGKIRDYKSAGQIGKNIINEFYGEYSEGSIIDWMGCDVQYDPQNDIYYVRTYHINPLILGGAYDVIIRSDGTVLAMWDEK